MDPIHKLCIQYYGQDMFGQGEAMGRKERGNRVKINANREKSQDAIERFGGEEGSVN